MRPINTDGRVAIGRVINLRYATASLSPDLQEQVTAVIVARRLRYPDEKSPGCGVCGAPHQSPQHSSRCFDLWERVATGVPALGERVSPMVVLHFLGW